jgi:hypothetical protein
MEQPHATVVLEIFSGRPDPAWRLDVFQLAELRRRLKALRDAGERTLPPEPGLGYRGLHVAMETGARGEIVAVRQGRVAFQSRILIDRDRKLERWLLDTAPVMLEPALLHAIKETL